MKPRRPYVSLVLLLLTARAFVVRLQKLEIKEGPFLKRIIKSEAGINITAGNGCCKKRQGPDFTKSGHSLYIGGRGIGQVMSMFKKLAGVLCVAEFQGQFTSKDTDVCLFPSNQGCLAKGTKV
jgi:hypothetical protein